MPFPKLFQAKKADDFKVIGLDSFEEPEKVSVLGQAKQKVTHALANKKWNYILFFPVSMLWMELVFKLTVYHSLRGFFYTLFFTISVSLFLAFLTSLFQPRNNRLIALICSGFLSAWFSTQHVYYRIFKVPLALTSAFQGAGDAITNFFGTAVSAVIRSLFPILLYFLPFVLLKLLGGKKHRIFREAKSNKTARLVFIGSAVFFYLLCTVMLAVSGSTETGKQDERPHAQYYSTAFSVKLAQPFFGVSTTLRLDFQHLLFSGAYSANQAEMLDETGIYDSAAEGSSESSSPEAPEAEVDNSPNILNIDFDALLSGETDSTLRDMHTYFSSLSGTKKNIYTGQYEGCNLIYMTCESFSHYAVNEKYTPTLYRLAHEGFEFDNFYNPGWGVSTSDGEYVSCQGLIPESGVWSFLRSSDNYLPFALGNQFKKLAGYSQPLAFHDHTYDFYGRDQSHPNMGYLYQGIGNGLDITQTWPESDLEMMQKTLPQYINSDKFHTYYMTVSGHMDYEWSGDYIASKNRDLVADLDLPEQCKCYLAANIELDRAMQYILEQLEAAGKLENTVIVMSADHNPYGLDQASVDAFAGHSVDTDFEIYKSSLIIWKYGQPHQVISQPVSSMDILPTVSNLFGLPYDSRLLMGRDVFSDSFPLVIFENRSWITDKARYNSRTGKVESLTGEEISDEYIKGIKNLVSNRFKYSALILDKDYYRVVLGGT